MSTLRIRTTQDNPRLKVHDAGFRVDFAAWLKLSEDIDSELVRGVVVERVAAQYPHASIFAWLYTILGGYVYNRNLGKVLGSRSAVKISNYDGRLPDILFVSAENDHIIHKDAICGAPDVVIEIVSENDRPGYLRRLANDYRTVGVGEIVFIYPAKKRVHYLKKKLGKKLEGYEEAFLTSGTLAFAAIPGFHIEVEWLFASQRPDPFTVTKQLIESASSQGESG